MLNFVASLAESSDAARVALDKFLESKTASLDVELQGLVTLLAPRRARWAADEQPMEEEPQEAEVKTARVRSAADDEDAKRELELFIENESSLDRERTQVIKVILRKMKADQYDHKQAYKLWLPLVDAGAKDYLREVGGEGNMFPKDLRLEMAKEYADLYKQAIENGEFDNLRVAEVIQPEEEQPQERVAESVSPTESSDGNEALANAVLAKVDLALAAVDSSASKYASAGRQDLLRIARELSEAISASFSAPGLKDRLANLSEKAGHVLRHFDG